MPASKMTPEIERIIIDLYTNDKLGAQAISDILLDDYGITLTRAPVGKHIKKLIKNGTLDKITVKANNIAQRSDQFGKTPNNYRTVRPITDFNRVQFPDRYPVDANFKVQIRRNKKTETIYTNTRAEADRLVAETTVVPVDPSTSKTKRSRTRTANEKEITKGSSAADKTNIKTIKGGIKKLNLYFKNDPDLINNSNFGKNVKSMLALRLDKDSGNPYSKLQSDNYYKTKAKQGQLFDLFDVNPVAGKKPGGRFSTNVNVTPNTFNRAFVGSQLTNFFNKGINEDTVSSLDKMFKDMNVRVDLPKVGKIGAEAGVGFDSKTGRFPTIDKTLQTLEAPQEVRNFFIQEATVPGSPICKVPSVIKTKADGGRIAFANGSNCAIEVGEAFDKNPKGFAQEVNKLPEEAGAFNKVKSVASKFLSVAKKDYKVASKMGKVGKFGAIGVAGAIGAAVVGRVKEFSNDDPSTYLSDEGQQKNMLIDMTTEPIDEGASFTDAQMPVLGAALVAGTIPGARDTYLDAITGRGPKGPAGSTLPATIANKPVGKFRATLGINKGVFGKGLAALGTPAGMLATEPFFIANQIKDGDSFGEIATNPMNYLGATFASPLTKMATKNVSPTMANIMRLGLSPARLAVLSRFGQVGLAAGLGIAGYNLYNDYQDNKGFFEKDTVGGINFAKE